MLLNDPQKSSFSGGFGLVGVGELGAAPGAAPLLRRGGVPSGPEVRPGAKEPAPAPIWQALELIALEHDAGRRVGRPAAADVVVVATAATVATCVRVAIELVDGAELAPFLPLSTS